MKTHSIFFISLLSIMLLIQSCNNEDIAPEGYYKAKITGKFCTLAVQVKGGKTTRELDKYEYIYIKNLPEELSFVGAEFYFEKFEKADGPICLGNTYSPNLTITVDSIFTKPPKSMAMS